MINVVIFKIGPVPCCVDSNSVLTVIEPPPHITAIPGSNAYRPGLFSYDKRAVAVYDMRTKFSLPTSQRGKIILSEIEHQLFGFWVDQIEQIISQQNGRLQILPAECPKELFESLFLLDERAIFKTTFEALAKAHVTTRAQLFIDNYIKQASTTSGTSSSTARSKPSLHQPIAKTAADNNNTPTDSKASSRKTGDITELNHAYSSPRSTIQHGIEPSSQVDSKPDGSKRHEINKPAAATYPPSANTLVNTNNEKKNVSIKNVDEKSQQYAQHRNQLNATKNISLTTSANIPAKHSNKNTPLLNNSPIKSNPVKANPIKSSSAKASNFNVTLTTNKIKHVSESNNQARNSFADIPSREQIGRGDTAKSSLISHRTQTTDSKPQQYNVKQPASSKPQSPSRVTEKKLYDETKVSSHGSFYIIMIFLSIIMALGYIGWDYLSPEKIASTQSRQTDQIAFKQIPSSTLDENLTKPMTTLNSDNLNETEETQQTPVIEKGTEETTKQSQALTDSGSLFDDLDNQHTNHQYTPNSTTNHAMIEKSDDEITITLSGPDIELETPTTETPSAQTKNNNEITDTIEINANESTVTEPYPVNQNNRTEQRAQSSPEDTLSNTTIDIVENDTVNKSIAADKTDKNNNQNKKNNSQHKEVTRIVHVVVKGDTLWHIAKRYIKDPFKYRELARLSKIKNPDLIYPGNRVIILSKTANNRH